MRTTTAHTQHSRILEFSRILPEGLLALLTNEDHVEGLHQRVISLFGVALCTVEPFLAWLS
jgi:hypothetical protein